MKVDFTQAAAGLFRGVSIDPESRAAGVPGTRPCCHRAAEIRCGHFRVARVAAESFLGRFDEPQRPLKTGCSAALSPFQAGRLGIAGRKFCHAGNPWRFFGKFCRSMLRRRHPPGRVRCLQRKRLRNPSLTVRSAIDDFAADVWRGLATGTAFAARTAKGVPLRRMNPRFGGRRRNPVETIRFAGLRAQAPARADKRRSRATSAKLHLPSGLRCVDRRPVSARTGMPGLRPRYPDGRSCLRDFRPEMNDEWND